MDGRTVAQKKQRPNKDFPLTPFVKCVDHGEKYKAYESNGHGYYATTPSRCCKNPARDVHGRYAKLLETLSLKKRYLDAFWEAAEKAWANRHGEVCQIRAVREKEAQVFEAKKTRIEAKFIDGEIDPATYRKHLACSVLTPHPSSRLTPTSRTNER